MTAVKKTAHLTDAQLKRERQSEYNAILSGRFIKTVYYETPDKKKSTKKNRSLYMRTAVSNVMKNMAQNRHDSLWAEVWNDLTGELIATVGRDIMGKVEATQYFDPVTGKKLRAQARKVSVVAVGITAEQTEKVNQLILMLHLFESSPAAQVFVQDGVFYADELGTMALNEVYRNVIEDLLEQIDTTIFMGETSFFDKKVLKYFEEASSYKIVQTTEGYDVTLSETFAIRRRIFQRS
jgi:hypothetical protein